MKPILLLKTLITTLLVFVVNIVLFAQSTPSGQATFVAPNKLSGCQNDTIKVLLTNKNGPSCTAGSPGGNLETITITIPGGTLINYVAGSLSANATLVSYTAGTKQLVFTTDAPSFGVTKEVSFVVFSDCKVGTLDPLPTFDGSIAYPVSFTPNATETFNSGKINTGVGNLNVRPYLNGHFGNSVGTNINRQWGATGYSVLFIGNTGYGDIKKVKVTVTTPNLLAGTQNVVTNSNPGWDVPTGFGNVISSTNDGTNTTLVVELDGINLGPDHKLAAGQLNDRLMYKNFTVPTQCGAWQINWKVEFMCADGSPSCQGPQYFTDDVVVSAGTPKLEATLQQADQPDGCPNKHIKYTIKNNGVGNGAPVGNAYDVDLNINLGTGKITIANLTLNGTAVPAANVNPAITVAAGNFKISLKNFMTTDPDGAGGISDIDGDGFFDDMLVGASTIVEFDYTMPCDDACGAALFNTLTSTNTFTDFCRTLRGSTSTELIKFGFEQAQPLTQAPTPDYGAWALPADTKTKTARFGFQYKAHNMNLAAATATLRINYSKRMEVNPATIKINGVAPTNTPVLQGTQGYTPVYSSADPFNATSPYDNPTFATDNDSAYTVLLTTAELTALMDASPDSLTYEQTYYGCGLRQTQGNGDNWQLLVKLTNTCTPSGTPCTFDLACKKPYSYSKTTACEGKPCFISDMQIYRNSPVGATDISLTTPINPLDSTRSYADDIVTLRLGNFISSKSLAPLKVGNYSGAARWKDGRFYFAVGYSKPKVWNEGFNIFSQYAVAGSEVIIHSYTPNANPLLLGTIGPAIFTAPIQLSDYHNDQYYAATAPATTNLPLKSYTYPTGTYADPQWYCANQPSVWYFNGFCPMQNKYWYPDGLPYSGWAERYINVADDKISETHYLVYGEALERAGFTGDLGDPNIYIEIKQNFRMNKAFPWDNSNDWKVTGGFEHYGNGSEVDYYNPASTYYGSCTQSSKTHLTVTKEETVKDPKAVYSASCGLTVHNKIAFKSFNGNYFGAGEVRVPYKVDSVVIDLPTEYGITAGTNSLTTAGGYAVTGYTAIANSAATGHVKFTNTGSAPHTYSDFPRFDDASGTGNIPATVFDLSYAIVKTGSAAPTQYKVPVKFYTRDEQGNNIVLVDTITIAEATPNLVLTPMTPILKNSDGGTCTPAFFDFKIQNNTLYDAPNSYFAIDGAGVTQIVDITDGGNMYTDPIIQGDTSRYAGGGMFVKLGSIGAGDIRIVRVYATTAVCTGTLTAHADFGCTYPAGLAPNLASATISNTSAAYDAELPNLLSRPIAENLNIANLCDIKTIEIEFRNTNLSNLYKVLAAIKLPTNADYVAGTAMLQAPYADSAYKVVPGADVNWMPASDSLRLDFQNMTPLSTSCGMEGADKTTNIYRFKFNIDFTACPVGTKEPILYTLNGENYCGSPVSNSGVVNLTYIGTSGGANTYACEQLVPAAIVICGDVGQTVRVSDTLKILNLTGPTTVLGDSLAITLSFKTTSFTLSNFAVSAPWAAPSVTTDVQGRSVLKFAIPAGIVASGSTNLVLSYDMLLINKDFCGVPGALDCPDISHSVVFYSTINLGCAAKGLTCTSLGTINKGIGLVATDLKCCASLGNKVWLDMGAGGGTANNGVQDGTEPGVAGVAVNLYQNGPDGLPGTADDVLVGSTLTDAYGIYNFTNLQPSTGATTQYNVRVTPPSNYVFTTQTNTTDDNNTTGASTTGSDVNVLGTSYSIDLSSGENNPNIDAGLVFPTPPATNSIGDKVWFDTNGDGIQDAGEPGVAGVTVTLYAADGVTIVATTTTDANGNYSFNNLPPNTDYKIRFSAPGGTKLTSSTGTTPGDATTNSDADPLTGFTATVNTGAPGTVQNGVDAGLVNDPKGALGDFVWNDLNHDGIQDAGEPGIAGVTMKLYDPGPDGVIGGGDDVLLATTTTDATGYYVFPNLDPAKYFVVATPPAGYTVSPKDATNPAGDSKDNDFGAGTAPYAGSFVSGVQTLLPTAGGVTRDMTVDLGIYNSTPNLNSIGDKVWNDVNKDGIQDAGEAGVANVTVRLLNSAGVPVNNPATGLPYVTVTDANGNYKFVDLPDGNYIVEFANLPTGFVFTGQNTDGTGITGANNSDANTVTGRTNVIALDPTSTNPASVNVVTVDAGITQGTPAGTASLGNRVWYDLNNNGLQDAGELGVAGVACTLKDANGITVNVPGTSTPYIVYTNALGEYLFTGLPAGTYKVEFSHFPAGYTSSPANAGANDGIDADASFAGASTVSTTATSGLYTLQTGEDNLTVDMGIVPPTGTNSLGNFVWSDTNGDGIQTPGEPGVQGVTVTLYNNGADGLPGTADDVVVGVTTTDNNGAYNFVGLPDGNYNVGFGNLPSGMTFTDKDKAGSTSANGSDANTITGRTGTIALDPAGANPIGVYDPNVDAGLVSTRAALGNYVWLDTNGDGIQDATEKGISGVTVILYAADGVTVVASTITDADGKYYFGNLTPGGYVVGFGTLPSGLTFTQQNIPGDNGDNTNSDADPVTGKTDVITLVAGETDLTVDAGLKPNNPASVGDLVWNDENGDGIQQVGEAGIPGILVTLKDDLGNVVGTAITDGNGAYLISNITPGTDFTITFSNLPAGATFTTLTSNVTTTDGTYGSDANTTTGVTAFFNLSAGQYLPHVDAGIINVQLLPLKVESFTALPKGSKSSLVWKITEQDNVAYYEVEFSSNGRNFDKIATVNNSGLAVGNYEITHNNPIVGINFYRIRIVYKSGSYSNTDIRTVIFGKDGTITIYPNPAVDVVNIALTGKMVNKSATITVLSIEGKIVSQTRVANTTALENINVNNLANGSYIIRVATDAEVVNKTIIVNR